jgi:hypothetical protein
MLVKYMCFQRMRSARLSTEITCLCCRGMVEPINASTSNWTDAFSFYFENLRKEYTYTTTMWCNRWASVRFFLGSSKQNPSIDSSDSMKWLKWYTSTLLCEEHWYFAIAEISQIISCHLSARVVIQEWIIHKEFRQQWTLILFLRSGWHSTADAVKSNSLEHKAIVLF